MYFYKKKFVIICIHSQVIGKSVKNAAITFSLQLPDSKFSLVQIFQNLRDIHRKEVKTSAELAYHNFITTLRKKQTSYMQS